MSKARLRKTFRYPGNESSEDEPEAMDEEGINALPARFMRLSLSVYRAGKPHRKAARRERCPQQAMAGKCVSSPTRPLADANANSAQRSFLLLPTAASVLFLIAFFTAQTLRERLFAILSISSLFATAYILRPFERKSTQPTLLASWQESQSPVELYLPYLNGVLCMLIALNGLSGWRLGTNDGASGLQAIVPGGMQTLSAGRNAADVEQWCISQVSLQNASWPK